METLLRDAFIYSGDDRHTCFASGALLISQGRIRCLGEGGSQLPDAPLATSALNHGRQA
ncbi:MAG: hypothetical protein ACKVQK_07895 [Burkholderiales bacterium]